MNDQLKELIDRSRQGDADAYSEIVRRFQADVRAYLKSRLLSEANADDLAQEVFIGAFKSIRKFEGNSSLKTWLISIAKFKIIDFLRAEERKQNLLSELQFALASHVEANPSPLTSNFSDATHWLKLCI